MRKITLICLMLFAIACTEQHEMTKNKVSGLSKQTSDLTPLEVVNKRMNFFNQHDYDNFIKLYHEDLKVYTYPDKLLGKGSDRLAPIFKSDFENKLVTVKIVNQMNNGPYVINHELVTNDGKETTYVSIYKVENGLITNVRFVRDF
ncbi:nuclear transport factor 2 family protein [Aquimarina algiphila]|uniref:nuclear transport factor 2 family protein n=1 Tax=Aquimarina algiphila TaxID=2047982 RepID=UPI00232FA21D|nr:nuclear transport factor 2 family protein [Aquimarina algiphila]